MSRSESAHSFEVKYLRPTLTKLFRHRILNLDMIMRIQDYYMVVGTWTRMGEVAEKVYYFIKIMAMLTHFSHISRAVVAVDHWHLGITNFDSLRVSLLEFSFSLCFKFFFSSLLLLVHLSVQSKVSQHRKHPSMLSIALPVALPAPWASQVPESWYILFVRHS